MLSICDVNEYRKCVKEFEIEMVSELYNTLHHLCNLLLVVPDNLSHACSQLVNTFITSKSRFKHLRNKYGYPKQKCSVIM